MWVTYLCDLMRIEKAFISERASVNFVDFLADELPELSKIKIKDAINKGAVWLKRGDNEPERVRRVKELVKLGDEIHIYYDSDFLKLATPKLQLISDHTHYSVWYKPANILETVSLFGDHLNLERVIDSSLNDQRDCYWVFPNSEAMFGVFLMAHSRNIAAKFEQMELQDSLHIDVMVERPTCEPVLERHDEFLLEAESADKRRQLPQSIQYFFDQAQGKELDILQDFSNRLEQGQLETQPVQIECLKLTFNCPIDGKLATFSKV